MASRRITSLVLFFLMMLPASSALANSSGPSNLPGRTTGPIVPRQDTAVRVDAEDLTFTVNPDLRTARVTARYTMTNAADRDASTEIAFIYVDRNQVMDKAPEITVDGTAVPFRTVTDAEFFIPLVDEWLAAHPAVHAEMKRLAAEDRDTAINVTELQRLLIEAGVNVAPEEAAWLVRYQRTPIDSKAAHAALLLFPEQTRAVYRNWSAWIEAQQKQFDDGPAATWLIFQVPFPRGARHAVSVSYNHIAAVEGNHDTRPRYHYEYLLSPARSWAGFGDLDVRVELPPEVALQSDFPLVQAEGVYSAHRSGLPDGELLFTLRSTKGVILGVDRPNQIWLLFLLVMAVPAALTGWFMGRRWFASEAVFLRFVATAFFGGLADCAWLALVWQVWEPRGPFRGLGIILGWLQAVAVMTAVSAIAGFLASRRSSSVRG